MNEALPQMTVGDSLPSLELPPRTRGTLAVYADGSGDHIPLHIGSDFAKRHGIDARVRIAAQVLTTDIPGTEGDNTYGGTVVTTCRP